MISFYAFRKSKQKDTALSSSNIVIYNQTIRTTKNTPNSSTGIVPHLAKSLMFTSSAIEYFVGLYGISYKCRHSQRLYR